MISPKFLLQFAPVMEAFGSNRFPALVLERIQKRLSDFSEPEMRNLCDLILDHCERAPTTSKVSEFAGIIRAKRHRVEEKFVERIKCDHCGDLGMVRIQGIYEPVDQLMRCDCREGKEQTWQVPQWIPECGSLFTRSRCPLEWFKPELPIDQKKGIFQHPLVVAWRARINESEKYFNREKP